MTLRIVELAYEHPDSAALRDAQQAEIAVIYGVPDSEPGVKPTSADMTVFFVTYDGDVPIACGGLRELAPDEAEIKRMYAAPEARGSGAASAVLRVLEDEARRRGYRRLVLETGHLQHAAQRFYDREGFARIPNFGPYTDPEFSYCYGKQL